MLFFHSIDNATTHTCEHIKFIHIYLVIKSHENKNAKDFKVMVFFSWNRILVLDLHVHQHSVIAIKRCMTFIMATAAKTVAAFFLFSGVH